MSDDYKRFVRCLKAATVGMTFDQIADILNVGKTTVRAYYNFTNTMNGEVMLRAIRLMGGYKC
jgi:hypothetical protein